MRQPKILIPYPGPQASDNSTDVYLYLRPESNGVKVESTLMRVLYLNQYYKENAQIVYLANMPGEYILKQHIIERHYSLNLLFASMGKMAFTKGMKKHFEEYYNVKWENAHILGAFEALIELKLKEEELFKLRVKDCDLLQYHGQTIKRVGNTFIINYDIPAILHKNTYDTDIAVMILRIKFGWNDFTEMIREMGKALISDGILPKNMSASRVFHYSKSPLEQILDGIGYLVNVDANDKIGEEDISFVQFLNKKGVSIDKVKEIINSRIVYLKEDDGSYREENIMVYTHGFNYEETYLALERVDSIYNIATENHLKKFSLTDDNDSEADILEEL